MDNLNLAKKGPKVAPPYYGISSSIFFALDVGIGQFQFREEEDDGAALNLCVQDIFWVPAWKEKTVELGISPCDKTCIK